MMKDIKIIVATHKKYQMPKEDIYLPLQVGAEKKEDLGYRKDNEGENISEKSAYYCELTGLYWAWKNLNNDYIGIVHYRRYFSKAKKGKDKFENIINRKEIENLLNDANVVLPKKRNYYIENLYSHYEHTMYIEPLLETGKIIEEKYPNYLEEFNKLKKRTSAHMFNMFIMKKEILDEYCKWLFNILFELEKRCNPTQYDKFHARYLGRISELLLDVWINTNNIEYKEIKVINMEKINWIKKGFAFLMAKFTGKKYNKSF